VNQSNETPQDFFILPPRSTLSNRARQFSELLAIDDQPKSM